MDVAAPSNFERMVYEASGRNAERTRNLFGVFAERGGVYLPPDILSAVRSEVTAERVDDATTAQEIARTYKRHGRVICPHTAVALRVARGLPRGGPIIALSTAHAAKFPAFVKQALGFEPEAPDRLKAVMDKPERFDVIDADARAVRSLIA
jgi:threonine synthase